MKVNKTLHTLSCGLLLSTLLLSCAAFAFWQVQGSGSDNARAAAFAVSAWMDRQTLYVSNSEGGRGSEVALRYSVELSLSEPLPEGVDVYFDNTREVWFSGNICVIPNAGELYAGSFTLTIQPQGNSQSQDTDQTPVQGVDQAPIQDADQNPVQEDNQVHIQEPAPVFDTESGEGAAGAPQAG